MNFEDDRQKDKRLSQLLSAASRNTAEPDKEFLDGLQEQSTAEFLASSANDTKKSQIKTSFPIWRIIMKSNVTKFAAAAVIIIAVLIGILFWGGSIDGASVAFARATEALREVSWIHIIEQDCEEWTNYDLQVRINKDYDGTIRFTDYGQGKEYEYNAETNSVFIYLVHGSVVEFPLLWEEQLNYFAEKRSDLEISYYKSKFKGKNVLVYTLLLETIDLCSQREVTVDEETDLPVLTIAKISSLDGTVIEESMLIFEYPQQGPATIYDIGAPMHAKIYDYSTGNLASTLEESADRLKKLGSSIAMYGNDNYDQDMYPDTLQELEGYIEDLQWFLENIEYIGKGKNLMDPVSPTAYDKTLLLENGQMTNILFAEGIVKFRSIKDFLE